MQWLITEHHSSEMPESFEDEVLGVFNAWADALKAEDAAKVRFALHKGYQKHTRSHDEYFGALLHGICRPACSSPITATVDMHDGLILCTSFSGTRGQ